MIFQTILAQIIERKDLSYKESVFLMEELVSGNLISSQIAAVLTALRMKGETADEILGFITVMRKHMQRVVTSGVVIDTCGTGGDGKGTFNISTCTGLVAAAAGVKVAKHGNRNVSSLCGSADVLEALGVKIELTPLQAEKLLEQTNFTFLFAPLYHPSVKHVVPVRKELKIRTIFNYLGPFISPASTKRQIIGVPALSAAQLLSQVARKLKYEHLLIVTSIDGLDEISTSAVTHVFEIRNNKCNQLSVNPFSFGIINTQKEAITGGDSMINAQIVRDILQGKKGPFRDTVVVNSAAALYVAGVTNTIFSGVKLAQETIDDGRAYQLLEEVAGVSHAL